MKTSAPRFPVGTRFVPARRHATEHTVVDFLVTTNLSGEVVSTRYVTEHLFCGQIVRDSDVVETTLLRASSITLPPPKNS